MLEFDSHPICMLRVLRDDALRIVTALHMMASYQAQNGATNEANVTDALARDINMNIKRGNPYDIPHIR